ncbi:ABC transporter permease [Acuticoccus kandeliae]|uniref:ABC transporter permease n=1 Tax=Acuticoccus kandeliae TaxID=2073160 RepID=UPI000D3ECBA9|nr:ABC transporter permease [Acuticoccus kandeliae]
MPTDTPSGNAAALRSPTDPVTEAAPPPRISTDRLVVGLLLVVPALALVCATILLPIGAGIYNSFFYDDVPSLQAYVTFFSRGQYLFALKNSLIVGFASTLLCVLGAFPACAYFASGSRRLQNVFLAGLGLCFIVSALIKTLAWSILLSRGGPIMYLLVQSGLIERPVNLLYTTPAVVIGTVQIVAPLTAAVLFAGMRKVDGDIVFATRSLGAGPVRTFFLAYLPQIRQSLAYCAVLTFVLSAGIYVTPALLGGPTNAMLGQVMQSDLVNDYRNGTALSSTAGTILTLVLLVISVVAVLSAKPYAVRRRA